MRIHRRRIYTLQRLSGGTRHILIFDVCLD
jgi:hypothetical protein